MPLCLYYIILSQDEMAETVVAYKKRLLEENYAVRSINSMLASLSSFLGFLGWPDCRMRSVKLQREAYCAEDKELSKAEYLRLPQLCEA